MKRVQRRKRKKLGNSPQSLSLCISSGPEGVGRDLVPAQKSQKMQQPDALLLMETGRGPPPGSQLLRRQNWVLLEERFTELGRGFTGATQLHAVQATVQNRAFIGAGRHCPRPFAQLMALNICLMLMPKVRFFYHQGPFFYHQGQLRSKIHPQPDGSLRAQGAASPLQGSQFPPQPPRVVSDDALSP